MISEAARGKTAAFENKFRRKVAFYQRGYSTVKEITASCLAVTAILLFLTLGFPGY